MIANTTILAKIEEALQKAMEEKKETVRKINEYENSEDSSLHTTNVGIMTMRPMNLSLLYGKMEEEDDRLNTLRLIKSELIRANEKNHHTNLEYKMSEDEEVKILLKMAEDHKENIKGYEAAGNEKMLNQEKDELVIIEEFTPAQPTEEEMTDYVNTLIDQLIAEKGADYKLQQKDMGILMKGAKAKFPNINGNIVKSALAARMS